MGMKELRSAAADCCEAFYADKKELSDLPPKFWTAVRELLDVSLLGDDDEFLEFIRPAVKAFGAPGDFGYGRPTGDKLHAFHQAWNTYLASDRPSTRTTAEQGHLR